MEKMQYHKKRLKPVELLDSGVSCDFPYVILNLGTHPTAYIGVPENSILANFDYEKMPLEVHGGLTYSKKGNDEFLKSGFYWYGWDYAHSGDYAGYYEESDDKRWTTKEIKDEVSDVSYQLSQIEGFADRLISKHNDAIFRYQEEK